MTSLTPFFTNLFVPALSTNTLNDSQLDLDFARVYSIINDRSSVSHRQPNYSLVETDQNTYLEVELPGVAKENINLEVTGNKLVISAKRFRDSQTVDKKSVERAEEANTDGKEEEEPKPSVVHQLKIRIGHRYDIENIQASTDGNGVLKMVIPMKKQETPRKILIE